DMALVVTEPTVAGRHDLERILDLLSHFKVPAVVCVNKSDLDEGRSLEIAQYCASRCVEVVGEIPFDEDVPRTLAQGQALGTGQAAREMRRVADRVHSLMAI
ncbi:MAG: (4Fe-4S)-binding protein, partial [Bacillota bacterium]